MSKMFAMVAVVEADDGEEAFARVEEEVSPEPANAHFVGRPVEVERAERYTSHSLARQIAGAPTFAYTADVAHRDEGLHLFAEEGDRNAFATAVESEGEVVRRGEGIVNDEESTKRLIAAEVADPVMGGTTSPNRSPVSASSPPLVLVVGAGEAGGSLATAAALACAGTGAERATLLVDLGGRRPRSSLLATPAARALEACVGRALPTASVAARGGFCQLALPADDEGFAALATAVEVVGGTPAVVHVPGASLAALLDAPLAPRASAVLLCRADGEDPPTDFSPLYLELVDRGLTLAVLERRLGWACERRALFGGLREDELHGLPRALTGWFAGSAAGRTPTDAEAAVCREVASTSNGAMMTLGGGADG